MLKFLNQSIIPYFERQNCLSPDIWIPMMRISWDDEGYFYNSYTKAFQDNYEQIKGSVLNPVRGYTQTWKDKRIPGFMNGRIPHRADSMLEYDLFGLTKQEGDFIALLARNNGKKHGDHYDVFPEIKPGGYRNYSFYFAIPGLATLIKKGSISAKVIADNITAGQKLEIQLLNDRANIYCQGIHIGHCPEYLHYLLTNNQDLTYSLRTHIINQTEYRYAYSIVTKLLIHSDKSIYDLRGLKPINPMPV